MDPDSTASDHERDTMRTAKDEVKRRCQGVLGVLGVGLDTVEGRPAVRVNVSDEQVPVPDLSDIGVEVRVRVIGQTQTLTTVPTW